MDSQNTVDAVDAGSIQLVVRSTPEIDRLINKLGELGVGTIDWLFLHLLFGDEIHTRGIHYGCGASPNSRWSRQVEPLSEVLAGCLHEALWEAVDASVYAGREWISYVTDRVGFPVPGDMRV